MGPTSAHLPIIAAHIVKLLRTPDLLFLQEIQDNSGETDDGVVDGTGTVTALIGAIESISGVKYTFTQIDPVNDQDGGVPGGNIRPAYLYVFLFSCLSAFDLSDNYSRYRPEKLQLIPGSLAGGSLDAIQVVDNKRKKLQLK